MNDGAGHRPFKRAVSAALSAVDLQQAAELSREWARAPVGEFGVATSPKRLTHVACRPPTYVVATLLGVRFFSAAGVGPSPAVDAVALAVRGMR